MRSRFSMLLALPVALAACSGNSSTGDPGGPAPAPSPAPSAPPPPSAPSSPLTPPAQGYQIVTPDFTIAPGDEKFMCFYTSLPTTAQVGVKRYQSQMTPGSHHMLLFATPTATQPNGTLADCSGGMTGGGGDGGGGGGKPTMPPVWTYAAQQPAAELDMPPGIGVVMGAAQPLIVNMHYLNVTGAPLTVHVTLNVETFAPGETFTPAAAFATFNTQIDIPPQGTQTVQGSCAVPPGAKFFAMSTHSHKYTQRVLVADGQQNLVTTSDWQHPASASWPEPFYQFASGKLTYSCDYSNSTSAPITVGESASKNEMCMAVGYFFPATKSSFCLNSLTIQ